MISKKALGIIVGEPIEKIVSIEGNTLSYYTQAEWYKDGGGDSILDTINIYELAFKCKDEAHKKGYDINSCVETTPNGEGTAWVPSLEYLGLDEQYGKNEPEAIIKIFEDIIKKGF